MWVFVNHNTRDSHEVMIVPIPHFPKQKTGLHKYLVLVARIIKAYYFG